MNIRILVRKGKPEDPVQGIIWYKSTGDSGGNTYGQAVFQIETPEGWVNIPVVEGDPL